MANQSTFPTTLDGTPTDMGSGDTILSSQWNQYMDAIDQLETKVGIDSSAVTGSIDYKLAHLGEGHITILPWHNSATTQGTWATTIHTGRLLNAYLFNSTNAQNDQIDYKAYLAAGTYNFNIVAHRDADRAILTLLIAGVSVGTVDFYNGTPAENSTVGITGIVVAASGLKTISFKAATRNGSSTGWYLVLGSCALYRTA